MEELKGITYRTGILSSDLVREEERAGKQRLSTRNLEGHREAKHIKKCIQKVTKLRKGMHTATMLSHVF